MSNTKLLKWYRFRISLGMMLAGTGKKETLKGIMPALEDYLAEHPETDYETLVKHFGTPKQIVESYWTVNGGQAAHHTAILSSILKVAVAVALFVAVTWGIVVAYAAIVFNKNEQGYTKTRVSYASSYVIDNNIQ